MYHLPAINIHLGIYIFIYLLILYLHFDKSKKNYNSYETDYFCYRTIKNIAYRTGELETRICHITERIRQYLMQALVSVQAHACLIDSPIVNRIEANIAHRGCVESKWLYSDCMAASDSNLADILWRLYFSGVIAMYKFNPKQNDLGSKWPCSVWSINV